MIYLPMKKSASTPMILLVGCIILLLNLAIHALVLSFPYIKRLSIALYRGARVYLQAILVVASDKCKAFAYYCLPVEDEGFIDTFLGVLLSDIGFAIAYLSRLGGLSLETSCRETRDACAWGRICE